jgi:CubicO group peptidase (beta-lactamase class C family)
VFTDREVLFRAASGVLSCEEPGRPVTPDSLFRLQSLTKILTGTAAVVLADRGLLDLDEPIAGRFPATAPGQFRRTTVGHLLSHTSGLARGERDLTGSGRDASGLARYVLAEGVHTERIAEPGEVFSYSDIAVEIAGYLIECATGRTFGPVMHDLLFEPLGMTSTCYDPLVAMTRPVSQQHVLDGNGRVEVYHRFHEAARIYPDAGAFSSVDDLARFGMFHLSGGRPAGTGERIVAADRLRAMRAPRADIGLDIDLSYGLTAYLGPRYGGHLGYGHEGYSIGTWCKLCLIPDLRIGLAWCDNRGPRADLGRRRYEAIDALLGRAGAGTREWRRPPGASEAGRHPATRSVAGTYRRLSGRPIVIEADGDGLVLNGQGKRIPLVPHWGPVFVADGALPGDRPPWAPHAGSERLSVCFVCAGGERARHLLLNGIAYSRDDRTSGPA